MRSPRLVLALFLSVISAAAADISGVWNITLEAPQGSAEATLTLKQDGDQVTGTYKGPRNSAPLTGTAKGDDIKLTATIDAGGQSVILVFTGKVDGDKIDGSLDFAGQANAAFKGTRQK